MPHSPSNDNVSTSEYIHSMIELKKILSKEEIDKQIERVAAQISSDYADKELILIGILKGSFIFIADLIRHITIPVKVDFIGASSYQDGTSPSDKITITKKLDIDIKQKDVLIVEDIIDTGRTLSFLINYLNGFQPATIKVCTHIVKHERREIDMEIDYYCHIAQGFLVGYGLDYNEDHRLLNDIYHLEV